MSGPAASVIVRARDEARTIGRTLRLLREQTVPPEIIVVDSGSTDGTLEIAERWCDRLIRIAPSEFSYGRALNLGAAAAAAPVHVALSAHCFPPGPEWIARSVAHYANPRVAGTGGAPGWGPDGRPLPTRLQDLAAARARPRVGFSNHASSWRASVWARHPFDERLEACEDKEWAFRVLADGWLIALDPELEVDMSHRWREGPLRLFRRERREARAFSTFAPMPPYGVREAVREWWTDLPRDRHGAAAHRFLNVARMAAIAGRYAGGRPAS
jgi:rhamnosyltransferase